MQCVLAVDGGNTKTIAHVASLDGTILGAGRGGCGDIYNAGAGTDWQDSAAAAVANIEYAVQSALQAAQVKASDLVTGVFSMAGACRRSLSSSLFATGGYDHRKSSHYFA